MIKLLPIFQLLLILLLLVITGLFYMLYASEASTVVSWFVVIALPLLSVPIYYLVYKNNIKSYYVSMVYWALLFVPWMIGQYTIDTSQYIDICTEMDPDELLFYTVLAIPFMFAIRGAIGRYQPKWVNQESGESANKYFIYSGYSFIPIIFLLGMIGGIVHNC